MISGMEGAGLVLAGGLSSRMGQNKAFMQPLGSTTMLQTACELCASLLPRTWVSCAKGRPVPGYPCIEDELECQGPAGGILAALEKLGPTGVRFVLALACDMPLMRGKTLQALIRAHLQPPLPLLSAYRKPSADRPEMLAAVYSIDAIPFFRHALANNCRSLWRIIPAQQQRQLICPPELEKDFFNCNCPEDLRLLGELSPGLPASGLNPFAAP